MDNLQFWLYVIIAVIYLISRSKKKNNPEDTEIPQTPRSGRSQPQQPPPISFEDLLREITEAKTPSKKPVVKSEVFDYEEDLKDEYQPLEDSRYDASRDDETMKVYEEAKRQAFVRPSLEESLTLSQTNMDFGRFKEFNEKKKETMLDQYIKDLRDPEGFKKAFILSEILNRRY